MATQFFDDSVRQILKLAATEAKKLGADHIGTEHLLLGLLAAESSGTAALLADQNVTRAMLLSEILKIARYDGGDGANVQLPYTSRAKRVIEFAIGEMKKYGNNMVTTDYLLLAILKNANISVATQSLINTGFNLRVAEEKIRNRQSSATDECLKPEK